MKIMDDLAMEQEQAAPQIQSSGKNTKRSDFQARVDDKLASQSSRPEPNSAQESMISTPKDQRIKPEITELELNRIHRTSEKKVQLNEEFQNIAEISEDIES